MSTFNVALHFFFGYSATHSPARLLGYTENLRQSIAYDWPFPLKLVSGKPTEPLSNIDKQRARLEARCQVQRDRWSLVGDRVMQTIPEEIDFANRTEMGSQQWATWTWTRFVQVNKSSATSRQVNRFLVVKGLHSPSLLPLESNDQLQWQRTWSSFGKMHEHKSFHKLWELHHACHWRSTIFYNKNVNISNILRWFWKTFIFCLQSRVGINLIQKQGHGNGWQMIFHLFKCAITVVCVCLSMISEIEMWIEDANETGRLINWSNHRLHLSRL